VAPSKPAHRRLLVLLRHGQYDFSRVADGPLTALGRQQAQITAEYLARTFSFDVAYASTMVRARETAHIVGAQIATSFRHSSLLREGFPTRAPGYEHRTVREDRARFDQALERFTKPARKRTTELLVCHGNLIRFFVCHALRIPPKTWLKFGTNHTGITRIVIKANGEMGVASYNETGHLPRKLVT
jgi:serine/threonine-protein phosphatase PGAM5